MFFLLACGKLSCDGFALFQNLRRLHIIARMTGGSLPRAFRDVCHQITLAAQEGLLLLCISVRFYVHLTANGKWTAHDRHLLQSVVPLATFLLDHSKTNLSSDLWRCIGRWLEIAVQRVPANQRMSDVWVLCNMSMTLHPASTAPQILG